jgi:hypothetical protein
VSASRTRHRLRKLSRVLCAKERAKLILNAYKRGEREEPDWRSGIPDGQVFEFARLDRLIAFASNQLVHCLDVCEEAVSGRLRLRAAWIADLTRYQLRLEDKYTEREAVAQIEKTLQTLRPALVSEFTALWVALRVLETALDDISAELDVADVLRPEARDTLESVKTDLLWIKRDQGLLGVEIELREPSNEELDLVMESIALKKRGGL